MSFQSSLKEREGNFEHKITDLKQKLEDSEERVSSLEIMNMKLREELSLKIEQWNEKERALQDSSINT
jgi:regulator of replication initiation timing